MPEMLAYSEKEKRQRSFPSELFGAARQLAVAFNVNFADLIDVIEKTKISKTPKGFDLRFPEKKVLLILPFIH